MSERDKLTFAAEQLEWADSRAGLICIANRARELRALAAQQPVEEPVASAHCHCCECPSCKSRSQASAPADQPKYDYRKTLEYAEKMGLPTEFADTAPAAPTETDLDALVAEAIADATASCRYHGLDTSADTLEKIAQAITDLRAEVERAKTQRDEAWKAFTRLRRAYSMVRYPTLTEELRLLYDAADAVAAGKGEEKS